jgi:hypothetical protein
MSSALVLFVIEHSRAGYCLFLEDAPSEVSFKDHPAAATTFKSLGACLEKLNTLKTSPCYARKVPIKSGHFYAVEVSVSAHARPTRYSVRPPLSG